MKKNYFNYSKFKDKYLLTNDLGRYCFLTKQEMYELVTDKLLPDSEIYQELKEKYFIYDISDFEFVERAGQEFRNYRCNLLEGTTLHIFVLTKQCNQQCVYCQASTDSNQGHKMTKEVAKRAVDFALQVPSNYLTFEFQGGEPLMNWPVLQYIIEYTEQSKKAKEVSFSLVSNLILLDEEKCRYLMEHKVNISTSLDGNKELHNKNRPYYDKDVFKILEQKMEYFQKEEYPVGAIQTTTKYSLQAYKEMIDQYVKFGLEQIFIRPLTPLGYAGDNWNLIGYTAEEFLEFYKNSLQYIIELNRQGIYISEGHAKIFLEKILRHSAGNYMELRSPCGGAIGQIAYYYDGNIYTCDEGRMLAEMGNDNFCLGNVYESDYNSLMESPACQVLVNASCLEGLNDCKDCVYHPYCGTCPVISFEKYGTVYPKLLNEYRCEIYKGIQKEIFNKLYEGDEQVLNIFKSWLY